MSPALLLAMLNSEIPKVLYFLKIKSLGPPKAEIQAKAHSLVPILLFFKKRICHCLSVWLASKADRLIDKVIDLKCKVICPLPLGPRYVLQSCPQTVHRKQGSQKRSYGTLKTNKFHLS